MNDRWIDDLQNAHSIGSLKCSMTLLTDILSGIESPLSASTRASIIYNAHVKNSMNV